MKKWCVAMLLVVMTLQGVSCASVQKKFTRKKKEPKHTPSVVYIEEGPYQKKYSNEYYYKTHYTYWKSWHGELLSQLGGNGKKVARCAQEASSNLNELSRYLVPEKQAELKPQVDALARISKLVDSGHTSQSEAGSLRSELEKIQRIVSNNFYYDKVQGSILPEKVDLGSSGSAS